MSPVSVYYPPSNDPFPTSTRNIVDLAGTHGTPVETAIGALTANSIATQPRNVVDGRATIEYRIVEGAAEGALLPWTDAIVQANAATLDDGTNEVLIKYDDGATVQYFPARSISVRDEPGFAWVTIDGMVRQPAWTVGITEIDSAYGLVHALPAGQTEQIGVWAATTLIPAATISMVTIAAATLTVDVAQSEDRGLASIVAGARDEIVQTIVSAQRRPKSESFDFDFGVTDAGAFDVRAEVNTALAATTPNATPPVDWDAGVLSMTMTPLGGDVTVSKNRISTVWPAGVTKDVSADNGGEEVIRDLVATVASGDPAVTLKVTVQRRIV